MLIYMTHEKHGVHIAYTDAEIKICESNGWKVYGPNPPQVVRGEVHAIDDVKAAEELVKPKRKYTRKAS